MFFVKTRGGLEMQKTSVFWDFLSAKQVSACGTSSWDVLDLGG
jgi:hypothetical protein